MGRETVPIKTEAQENEERLKVERKRQILGAIIADVMGEHNRHRWALKEGLKKWNKDKWYTPKKAGIGEIEIEDAPPSIKMLRQLILKKIPSDRSLSTLDESQVNKILDRILEKIDSIDKKAAPDETLFLNAITTATQAANTSDEQVFSTNLALINTKTKQSSALTDGEAQVLSAVKAAVNEPHWAKEGQIFLGFGRKLPTGVRQLRDVVNNPTLSEHEKLFYIIQICQSRETTYQGSNKYKLGIGEPIRVRIAESPQTALYTNILTALRINPHSGKRPCNDSDSPLLVAKMLQDIHPEGNYYMEGEALQKSKGSAPP